MTEDQTIPLAVFLRELDMGEDLIIEYCSENPTHLLFYSIVTGLKEIGRSFIIIDELDQLHIFKTHLRFSGLDTSIIDETKVVKFGGVLNTGNVIGRVELTEEPPVRKRRYEKTLQKLGEERRFRLVLGFDKVIRSYENDPRELERIFGYLIRPHLGDEERTTVYMINTGLVGLQTLKELREHASRVLSLECPGNDLILTVIKSLHVGEYGTKVSVDNPAKN
ncbi:DUF257 family protein [Thermococcus sp.]|uniref:DUF257 family protein n=1 Tax=Thermococcus sp. TaxID=35749 RepID=UPI0026375631|nr:DUF257 family protein [Thermococcus sp.]